MSRVSGAAGAKKKRIPSRLVGWDATLPADHTPTTFATRQGGQADERAENEERRERGQTLSRTQNQRRGGSAALIMLAEMGYVSRGSMHHRRGALRAGHHQRS